jgi:hypothetical protein
MKAIALTLALVSTSAFANLCTPYDNRPEYMTALKALVTMQNKTMDEVCNSERIVDIEIQPSQVIIGGEIIPQWAVYFHYNEDSCKYLLNRADLTLTESRCFPTW